MNSLLTGWCSLRPLTCRQRVSWLFAATLVPFLVLSLTIAVINSGVVHVTAGSSTAVAAPQESHSLHLQKEAEPKVIYAGETVTYTFTITNSGADSLIDLILTDDHLGLISDEFEPMEPDESRTIFRPEPVSTSVTNLATITGTLFGTEGMVIATALASVQVITPTLEFALTAEPELIISGDEVEFSYVITNSGNITLTGMVIDSELFEPFPAEPFELAPDQIVTFTHSIVPEVSTTEVATVTAQHPLGEIVFPASAFVDVIDPAIQVSKTATPTLILSGEAVTYTYRITNSGDVTLASVTLFDDQLGQIGSPFTLAPSAAVTLVQTAAPRVDVTNVASVIGTHPLGTVSAQATAFVKVNHRVFLPTILNDYPSWQQVGNKPAAVTRFYDVAVCGDRYLAGTNSGLYRLEGDDWLRETAVPDSHVINRLTIAGSECNLAYVTTLGSGLWFGRYNNGWQWHRVDSDADATAAVVIRGNTVFVGGSNGVHWSAIPASGQVHTWQSVNLNGLVLGLTLLPGSDTIFAAVWTKGVYANSGGDPMAWTPVGVLPNLLVYEAVGSAAGTPYLAGTLGGLYSWQSGAWSAVTASAGNATFAVAAGGNRLYAGLQHQGVLVSYDGGVSWSTMNHGLYMPAGEEFQVRGFFVSPNGEYLYAATTSGVWRWPRP
jgi:uncharacterized repeat protein (TIGR01451 family)